MPRDPASPTLPGLLFALRLRPPSPQGTLQGEIEQVLSGERCRFVDAGELLAWLQDHSRAGPERPLQAPGERGDSDPGPDAREATT